MLIESSVPFGARVAALLDRHARAFGEGRLADMLDDHAFPHPMYLEDRLVVLRSRCDLLAQFTAHRRLLAFRGMTVVTPRVERVEEGRDRARAWVRWTLRGNGGLAESSRAVLYYGQRPDGRPVTEMTDYTHLAVPDLKSWRPHAA